MYKIELVDKKTNKVTTFNDVVDVNEGEKLYYRFQLSTKKLADGEYTLNLYECYEDGDEVLVATDTLIMGDFNEKTLQYKKGENIFIDTIIDAVFEDKKITIDTIQTTILPTEGIDGMTEVVVNAQPVYTNGYTAGMNAQKNKLTTLKITENGEYSREDGYKKITVDVPDLNGSYDNGYTEGYNKGTEDGIQTQKGKLEAIEITENGEYSREDGYNSITVNVASTGGGDINIEETQVLNITENGVYPTQYSKLDDVDVNQATGYFNDGTPFADYAELYKLSLKTDTELGADGRLEFWWKYNNKLYAEGSVTTYGLCGGSSKVNTINVTVNSSDGVTLVGNIGKQSFRTPLNSSEWYHIILSINEGFVVNGEKIGEFNDVGDVRKNNVYINEEASGYAYSNGCFGMVKINDDIYIPTETGFINYNTKELLTVIREGEYKFIDNPSNGYLIRTVNVNIPFKINVGEASVKFAYSSFAEVPEWADFADIIDMGYMFYNNSNLAIVQGIDTSKAENFQRSFYGCTNLKTIQSLDTSSATNMEYTFYNCNNLTSIPQIDTSNVIKMSYMINGCKSLVSVPPLIASKVTTITNFCGVTNLTSITDFGGLIGLKTNITNNSLDKLPNLTYESCINILNGLYDFVGNSETPTSSQGQLKVHSNFLTTVGDEISIGTSKGWAITA